MEIQRNCYFLQASFRISQSSQQFNLFRSIRPVLGDIRRLLSVVGRSCRCSEQIGWIFEWFLQISSKRFHQFQKLSVSISYHKRAVIWNHSWMFIRYHRNRKQMWMIRSDVSRKLMDISNHDDVLSWWNCAHFCEAGHDGDGVKESTLFLSGLGWWAFGALSKCSICRSLGAIQRYCNFSLQSVAEAHNLIETWKRSWVGAELMPQMRSTRWNPRDTLFIITCI